MKNYIYKTLFLIFVFQGEILAQSLDLDLDFIYHTIVQNHPGIYNDQDPTFKYNLEVSYQNAKQALLKTTELDPGKQIISKFAKSFDDVHLWIQWYGNEKRDKAIHKKIQHFSIASINEEVVWLALPTFDLSDKQLKDFNQILTNLPKCRNKKLIVFDLRGNQGGNSLYGEQIVEHLFGKKYATQKRNKAYKTVFVDWRASPDNLLHIDAIYQVHQIPVLKVVSEGIKASLANNQPYYREYVVADEAGNQSENIHHGVTAKLIVIIDGSNVSAALDFIDELKIMEVEVTLVGQKTKADKLYMEVRQVALPSGLGVFSFPIKVFRNRSRADNEPYVPDIAYETTDTKELQKYVLNLKL